MRNYSDLLINCNSLYKELCEMMHDYENDKVDINEKFKELFNVDLLGNKYEVNIENTLKIDI